MAAKMQPTLEQAYEKLDRLHIKLSPQRSAILEILHQHRERPSIEAVCRLLAPRFSRMNATSVRNSVLVFEKMGLIPGPDTGEEYHQSSIHAG